MPQESEQWLLDGDCKKCRRKQYCSKSCKAAKTRQRAEIFQLMDDATGGMLSTSLRHIRRGGR